MILKKKISSTKFNPKRILMLIICSENIVIFDLKNVKFFNLFAYNMYIKTRLLKIFVTDFNAKSLVFIFSIFFFFF